MDAAPVASTSREIIESELDFNSICRCCLTKKCKLQPIFNSGKKIPELVFDTTGLKLEKNDGLPDKVCTNCVDEMMVSSGFRTLMQSSQRFLPPLLGDFISRGILNRSSTAAVLSTAVFINICRLCLRLHVPLKPIFETNEPIANKIFALISTKINKNDGFPSKICTRCLVQLRLSFKYKKSVESADLFLRDYVRNFKDECKMEISTVECEIEENANVLVRMEVQEDSGQSKEENETTGVLEDNPEDNSGAVPAIEGNTLANATNKDYWCSLCNISYENKLTYICHIKDHIPQDKIYRCNMCGKKFTNKLIFKDHQISHAKHHTKKRTRAGLKYECQTCEEDFGTVEDFFIHMALHKRGSKFHCKACGKRFTDLEEVKRHMTVHFKSNHAMCKNCEMSCVEMAALSRFSKKRTETKQKPIHICLICKKRFPNQYTLKFHTRKHAESQWKCLHCDKSISNYLLTNSKRHPFKQVQQYECNRCGKRFRHFPRMVVHMRKHISKCNFRCTKCENSYRKLWIRRIPRRPFNCYQCSEVFTTYTTLKEHLEWHIDQANSVNQGPIEEAPLHFFRCAHCSAEFLLRADLTAHEKLSHTLMHEYDVSTGRWRTPVGLAQYNYDQAPQGSTADAV